MKNSDLKRKNRILFIIEAALEYFIWLAVSGAYLAALTTAIGISDALTGVLTSFVSLGCGFQILSVFFYGDVKRTSITLHLINEIAFTLLYVTPFFRISQTAKTLVFIILMMIGYGLNNIANPRKTEWYMQAVDNDKRGVFTANKEIVSLVSGMLFSLVLGYIIDEFEAAGNLDGAFITIAIVLCTIMLLHSLTIISSSRSYTDNAPCGKTKGTEEKDEKQPETSPEHIPMSKVLRNKNILKVVVSTSLWYIVTYSTVPFFGTYQIKELGFSMVFVSVLSIVYGIVRVVFERPIGKIADKKGFAFALNVCYTVETIALAFAVFTRPENGKVMYTIYYVLYAICVAGTNSGELNIVYDYIKPSERVAALAIKKTVAGLAGFFTTLALCPLVSLIQSRGLVLFGVNIYAQQVTSFIGLVVCVLLIVYNSAVIRKIK